MSIRTTSIALVSALALTAPAALAAPSAAPTKPVAASVQRTEAPIKAPSADADRYAEREVQDREVTQYEGGSTVVISMSGATLVLILLLLIII